MATAHAFAECSTAIRLKVGAIAVKDDRIISIGYNGTVAGWDNNCEVLETRDSLDMLEDNSGWEFNPYNNLWQRLFTRPEVMHAERNCLDKLARSHESGHGAAMFVTHATCL